MPVAIFLSHSRQDAEIVAVTLGNGPNAIAAALSDLLTALGLRLPDDPLLPTPMETVPRPLPP